MTDSAARLTATTIGMSLTEQVGLRWTDADLDAGVRVAQALARPATR